MTTEYSFDVVSDFDEQEMVNALDQTRKELMGRFDFRDTTWEVNLEKEHIELLAGSDMHLKQLYDIVQSRAHKRGIDIRIFDPQTPESAAKGNLKQTIKFKRGIDEDLGRKLNKRLKDKFPKVQVRIQGDQLRVTSKDKDALQAVITDLRGADDIPVPLQFKNYR